MDLIKKLLDNDFIKDILCKYFQEDVEVQEVNVINDVTKSGENFCSLIRRVNIVYLHKNGQKHRTLSMIAKCLPEDDYQAKYINDMNLFGHESKVYNDVIPLLSKLDYHEKMSPNAYYCCSEPSPLLLLEDLSPLNYKVMRQKEGLDLKHCLLTMEKLAYFHAASFALLQKNSKVLTQFNQAIFHKSAASARIISASYDEIVKISQNVPDLNKYVEKLKLAKQHVLDKMFNVPNEHSNFKVLTQGDFWTNNIMFCYDHDGFILDVAFVDFQTSCFASASLDLHYFLATSPKLELKYKYNVLLDHYFENLMRKLGHFRITARLTRQQLDEDFRSFAHCGLGASLLILPFIKARKSEGGSVQAFLKDDSITGFRYHCFSGEDYLKEVSRFLPLYDSFGVFNI